MNITCKIKKLRDALAIATRVVPSSAPMPILKDILFTAEGDRLSLMGTNLDVAIRCSTEATVAKAGTICLPGQLLLRIVGAFIGDEVTIETTETYKATISCGASTFKLMAIPSEEYPLPTAIDVPPTEVITLQQQELSEMLGSVLPAQSTDETRYVLNGVLVQREENNLLFAATDGRRLHINQAAHKFHHQHKLSAIVPTKTVALLAGLLEDDGIIQLTYNARHASFKLLNGDETIEIWTKLIEGSFPNFRQVIPKGKGSKVTIPRLQMLEAIRRVSLAATDKSSSVKLSVVADKIELHAESPDLGSADDAVAAVNPDKVAVITAANPAFLRAMLEGSDEESMTLSFSPGEASPIVGTAKDFLVVIMPVRLS